MFINNTITISCITMLCIYLCIEDSWDPREFQLPPQSVACGCGENVGMMVVRGKLE